MKNVLPKYISRLFFVACCFILMQACYKDKGNYNYTGLPPAINIDTNSYSVTYQKKFIQDTLTIDPLVYYAGDTSDLSYEWQIWKTNSNSFSTLQKGRKLVYKCGPDTNISSSGNYFLRLAVSNSKLADDTSNHKVQAIYSRVISFTVVTSSYLGLMVLHGNGTQCDVGLIESNFFLPKSTLSVTTKVTPNLYSYYNQGLKIPGVGKQVEKVGVITVLGSNLIGNSNVYIFTDKANIRTDYKQLEGRGSYSALFAIPSYASGKPQFYTQIGENQSRAMVDDGRLFYGNFVGPLFNDNFSYYAAPYVGLVGDVSVSRGAVVFDTVSKAFLYSSYNQSTSVINKFPASNVSGVDLHPDNMKANLIYMNTRGRLYNTLAVMKDIATGNKYLAEFNFGATDASQVSIGRYPMENLPEQDKIRFYAFGRELNMVYYGTDSKLYQYLYQAGNTANVVYAFPAGETITAMKVIKYEYAPTSKTYQYSNKQMVVATVDLAGNGKVYAFAVNTVTGAITLNSTFTGFEKIYDMSVKDQ